MVLLLSRLYYILPLLEVLIQDCWGQVGLLIGHVLHTVVAQLLVWTLFVVQPMGYITYLLKVGVDNVMYTQFTQLFGYSL